MDNKIITASIDKCKKCNKNYNRRFDNLNLCDKCKNNYENDLFKNVKDFLKDKLNTNVNHFGVDLKNKVINVGIKNKLIIINFSEFINWLDKNIKKF